MKRLLILLVLASQPVWAGWEEIGQWPGGRDIEYVDWATLRRTAAGGRVWTMSTHDSPMTHRGVSFRSARELIELDCAGERMRMLQQDLFSGLMLGGTLVYRATNPAGWSYPAPATTGESLLNIVCKTPRK
jgi:hypothetical protein